MNLIVLAAGLGSRLGPAGFGRPKCLVSLHGRPLLAHIVDSTEGLKWQRKLVISGYRAEMLPRLGLQEVHNPDFASTTMVYSLSLAGDALEDDYVVIYGDVVVPRSLVLALRGNREGIAVAVDFDWETAWRARYDDPFVDAERLQIHSGRITAIGGRASTANEVDAHYVGALSIAGSAREAFNDLLRSRGQHVASMTDLLSEAIGLGLDLTPVATTDPWAEIDTPRDLQYAHMIIPSGKQ